MGILYIDCCLFFNGLCNSNFRILGEYFNIPSTMFFEFGIHHSPYNSPFLSKLKFLSSISHNHL